MKRTDFYQEIVNNIYMLGIKDLELIRKKITGKEICDLADLLEEAIGYGIHSVTEKKRLAPSNDPHDYMSTSIYHWPNPDTADGLPYIHKDGVDNPEAIHGDKESLRTLAYITYLSSLLYYLTLDDIYLDYILKYNNFWFIDETTRMNPNLRYAQCIPGVNDGEPGGIIDYAASYSYALNMLTNLNKLKMLPTTFVDGMKRWHNSFLEWLKTSEQGIIEGSRTNNQGALYDLLIINISNFLGKLEENKDLFYEKLLKRLEQQIDDKGLLPLELHRTKTKSYTTMALKMLLEAAYLLDDFDFSNNVKLLKAFKYIKNHYLNNTWEFMQIKSFDPYRGYYILILFSKILNLKVEITFEKMEKHWGYILLPKLI